jgi:hypothetical protein
LARRYQYAVSPYLNLILVSLRATDRSFGCRGGTSYTVTGVVSSVNRCRWAVAIAALLAVATVGFGWQSSSPTREGRAPDSGAIEAGWAGWRGAEAVIPAQRKIDAVGRPERDLRLKPVLVLLAVATALFAVAAASCAGRDRSRLTPLPLTLRSRSVPLRAPPLLRLG